MLLGRLLWYQCRRGRFLHLNHRDNEPSTQECQVILVWDFPVRCCVGIRPQQFILDIGPTGMMETRVAMLEVRQNQWWRGSLYDLHPLKVSCRSCSCDGGCGRRGDSSRTLISCSYGRDRYTCLLWTLLWANIE